MLRRLPLSAALVLLAALVWPPAMAGAVPAPAPASADPSPGFAFFPETGHNIGLKIKRFYDAHGGLDIFGLPLTEVFQEDGLQVQYFERARFELHPELPPEFNVSLSRLGAYFTQYRTEPPSSGSAARPAPTASSSPRAAIASAAPSVASGRAVVV